MNDREQQPLTLPPTDGGTDLSSPCHCWRTDRTFRDLSFGQDAKLGKEVFPGLGITGCLSPSDLFIRDLGPRLHLDPISRREPRGVCDFHSRLQTSRRASSLPAPSSMI